MKFMIDDVPAEKIAHRFGTPVYVYSQTQLEKRMKEYTTSFADPDFNCHVVYASKAFNCIAMLQLTKQEGLYVDVVSGGELYTAIKAGYDMKHVVFHGNNKTDDELHMAFEAGVGIIVIDNLSEMHRAAFISQSYPNTTTDVLIRINPGIDAHTHKYIMTADPDSKFGTNLSDTDTIDEMAKIANASQRLIFRGFHSHIGSQIFETVPFEKEIEKMCEFTRDFQARTGIKVSALDLGGGFGVKYIDEDKPVPVERICSLLLDSMKKCAKEYGLAIEDLYIEPGRSIVAEAGCTLYTVGDIKDTVHKRYVFIDGGMNDNIRPALYQADYKIIDCNDVSPEKTTAVTIAGKCCESGDVIAENVPLPEVKRGDILAVLSTGAYGQSMASHYNKLFVPGVVFVHGDQAKYVVRPETYEDLVCREESL